MSEADNTSTVETQAKNENNNGGNKSGEEDSPRERPKKQYFEAEFDRLQTSLAREATRIVRPEFKQYSPFIWTSLKPYYNTHTVQFLLTYPEHVKHGFITRKTAIGLVDPEVSHSMDVELDEVPESRAYDPKEMFPWIVRKPVMGDKKDMSRFEGSTRLPKWPVVKFEKPPVSLEKVINWGDVPRLREELKVKYSNNAQVRKQSDYTRTSQDWDRMELNELKNINEINRSHMRMTCHTYLGTSPGSRKAVSSLAKILD